MNIYPGTITVQSIRRSNRKSKRPALYVAVLFLGIMIGYVLGMMQGTALKRCAESTQIKIAQGER